MDKQPDTLAVIRMCHCGTFNWPPSDTLRTYREGDREYATCPICKRTWDVKTLKPIEEKSCSITQQP